MFAVHWPGSVVWLRLVGQVRVGGRVSLTTTWKVQETEFPAESVRVYDWRVIPRGNCEPLLRPEVSVCSRTGVPQLSVPRGRG